MSSVALGQHASGAERDAPAIDATRVVPQLAGLDAPALNAAYTSCAEVVRRRARNFYYGLRLTPEPRRAAVYSIYAWMRCGDDLVDEGADPVAKRAALASFRERTARALSGRGDALAGLEPFWAAFAASVASYAIDHALIWSMVDGLESDIDHAAYDTREQLDRYCYCVASTVGLVCLGIWGYRPGVTGADVARAEVMAERRGRAFQLTNILRDFAQDFDQHPRRVYIPGEVFASVGLTPQGLRDWAEPSRCRELVAGLAAEAREHYRASAGLEELVEAGCRPTLWAMTRIYSGLLEVIEREPARVVGPKRIRLASWRKAWIALAASARAKLGG